MKSLAECRLYTFVDAAYLHGRKPADVARALCEGGSDIIQLRAKERTKSDITRTAAEILPITDAAGVWLVINDYPEVALETGAPACHLGQEDFFDAGFTKVAQVRDRSSNRPVRVGLSSHAPEQAQRAVAAGADYVAVGPVFATGTKPGAKPVTLEYVRWARVNINIPWFAIGGITLDNVGDVLASGARRVCVVSAILNAPDITAACAKFRERLASVPLLS
jgi:thiamine-phosphate pyrophosphorylase